MQSTRTMTAEGIMAVPASAPWRLFSTGTIEAVKHEFRDLARRWHPDLADGDPAVFRHLTELRDAALGKIQADAWRRRPERRLRGRDGRERILRYAAEVAHDAGSTLIGHETIAHVLSADFAEFGPAAAAAIKGITWKDAAMRDRLGPTVPDLLASFETDAGDHVLVMRRYPDMIRLRDLLDHCGGRLEPRHVAWILRRTASIACLLEFSGLYHGDISPDSVWVTPATHGVSLLGGWWFAGRLGDRLQALPTTTVDLLPPTLLQARTGTAAITLERHHLLARELLGDAYGSRADPDVPAALRGWARMPAADDAIGDFRALDEALAAAFGPRRFVAMPVDAGAFYQEV